MAKLLKIIGRTIGITLEWLLVIVIALVFLIRISAFQTYLGGLATDYLSSEMNTEMRIGKIDIVFLNRAQLKDVYVEDLNGDTLASIHTIDVRIGSLGDPIVLKRITLDKGRVGINRNKKSGDFNFQFIIDYFDSGAPKDPNSKPTAIEIGELALKNVDLSYDDNRKDKLPFGIDYDHLHFKQFNLLASNFTSSEDGVLGLKLKNLSGNEQCGLQLKQLSVDAQIHPKKGILLSNVVIQTPKTNIYATKFNLRLKSFDDFAEFNSKVKFEGQIDSSNIDLKDVSYFVSALEGMDQMVYLSTNIDNPIDNLLLSNLDFRFGTRSVIRGDYRLPNFALDGKAIVDEEIDYCYLDIKDIEAMHLPKSAGMKSIDVGEQVRGLAFVELRKFHVNGKLEAFVLKADKIGTAFGNVKLNNGIQFNSLKEGGYAFTKTANSNYDVYIDSFQLGKFINVADLGSVTGSAFLTGVVGQKDGVRLTEVEGDFQNFGYNNYNYKNIAVNNGSFINNVFKSTIDINDPHLAMHYDGIIDLNKEQRFDIGLKVTQADLQKLNFSDDPNARVLADIDVNMHGTNIDNYQGTVSVDQLVYYQQDKKIEVPDLDLFVTRGATRDSIVVESQVVDIHLGGKISSGHLVTSLNNSFAELLPTIIKPMKEQKKNVPHEFFDADITLKQTREVLDVYYPELHITPGSVINLTYDSKQDLQTMSLTSNEIALIPIAKDSSAVQKQYLSNVRVEEKLQSGNLETTIKADKAAYNDSLYVSNFDVLLNGHQGKFDTKVLWNQGMYDPASIEADLELKENNAIAATMLPSYFSIEGQKWEIKKAAGIVIENEHIVVNDLSLERENQLVRLNGVLSNDENEQIELTIRDLHVEEFMKIIDPTIDITARLDGKAYLKTPFTQPQAEGDMSLSNLILSKQEVGTVNLNQFNWNPTAQSLFLFGELIYQGQQSFEVSGNIFPMREENNYKLRLDFKDTDISFANAFVEPELVSNIKGKLRGNLNITGKLAAPAINGTLAVKDAGAKIGILGTTYDMAGNINFEASRGKITGFLPVHDKFKNIAIAKLDISHTDFQKMKINLDFLFDDEYVNGLTKERFTGKFMVLDTQEKPGEIYYGQAFASGKASIKITDELVKIDVTAKTEEGTKVNLPMYGASEVSDFDFIEYYDPNDTIPDKKRELSGVEMALNLHVTPAAEVNLIFNPKTGDAIQAFGEANILKIRMKEDNLTMDGTYVVSGGAYNLAMYGLEQKFVLEKGGTISWTGSPYNTALNLKVSKSVYANFSDLSGESGGASKNVKALIAVTGNLNKPKVALGIDKEGLTANESNLVDKATATEQDAQAQWFNLVKSGHFLPLNGGSSGGGAGSALRDQGSAKANELLGNLTGGVLNFSSKGSESTSETVISSSKQLGDKVIITGATGVQKSANGQESASSIVGDVKIDVLLNQDGSLRTTIFNETNEPNSVSAENGAYTQGVSIKYSESFNKTKDSQVLRFLGDMRNRKGTRKKKKSKKVKVDDQFIDPNKQKEKTSETPANTEIQK